MRDTIAPPRPRRRGGSWTRREDRVALGHRRLSIVDLSPAGHQPMSNEDGTVWITFNGEIYNHAELRAELEAKGHRFRSHTDTETIVHLYEEEGRAASSGCTGCSRFAIWDSRTARAVPRARPARHQAALLRAAARRLRLRLGDQGAARAPGAHAPTSTRRRSSTT